MKRFRILCMALCILMVLTGCRAYREHSTDISTAVGEWVLDSKYVNTRSVEHDEAYMTINSDYSGSYTVMEKVTTTGADGQVTYVTEVVDGETVYQTQPRQTSLKVSSSEEGILTLTMDGSSVNYRFNVDEAAGNLHMWIDEDGDEVHYVYILRSVY